MTKASLLLVVVLGGVAALVFLLPDDASAWSARWVERIDEQRIAVVWRRGCGDLWEDQGRVEALRVADGSFEAGAGGEGAYTVVAKTPGVLWLDHSTGLVGVDLPEMVRHRVQSTIAAHPQLAHVNRDLKGTQVDQLVLGAQDQKDYGVSVTGEVTRLEGEESITPIELRRVDLESDRRRPSGDDRARAEVFWVSEAGRPVAAGAERWLVASGRERQNVHAVGSGEVAWSRAVADLAGAKADAGTYLLWASDDEGLALIVGSRTTQSAPDQPDVCTFTNVLVRLDPNTGATLERHELAPTD